MKNRLIFLLLFVISALFIVSNKTTAQQKQEINSCLECHGNAEKMKEFGFPQFTVTNEEAQKQTKMQASCTDCHLGNPTRQRMARIKGCSGFMW